jgi:hypothetical protein
VRSSLFLNFIYVFQCLEQTLFWGGGVLYDSDYTLLLVWLWDLSSFLVYL